MTQSNITRRRIVGGIAASVGFAAADASGDIIGAARAQPARKTFVLVHGTLVGGWYWRRVSDLLEKKGHKVFSPTLTGLGERSHLLSKEINLDTHITDVVNVVKWEDLDDICLVVHSYGGWIGSGALEQIGDRVSSIVWLDAFKPEDGQKPIDFTSEGFRKAFLTAMEKGEAGFPVPLPKLPPIFVNEKDRDYVDSKLTPQPVGTYAQAIRLSGAREKVAKKTYIRATKFPNPAFDKALAECRADKSWSTFEVNAYHIVMLDEPEWLADTLMKVA
jgi:pimeloyl-ACP methyl ester carboxylesterase